MAAQARLKSHLITPLYTYAEAARMLRMSPNTLHNWATGYVYKRVFDQRVAAEPLITSAERRPGTRARLPFIGLAEAYTLAAFRAAKVPVVRIRPAIKYLEENFGLRQALASERLMTDGAEVLYDFAHHGDDPEARDVVEGLVVVRNGQQVFRPVVQGFLKRVVYRDGWTAAIELPAYRGAEVIADPLINGGQPTVRRRGIRVEDVLNRINAGEAARDVADDYGLKRSEISALVGAG